MRSFTKCLAAALLALAAGSGTAAIVQDGRISKSVLQKLRGNPQVFHAPMGGVKSHLITFGNTQLRDSRYLAPAKAADNTPTATVGPTSTWGVINGPGGTEWLYEQENEIVGWSNITSSRITVYNDQNETVGTITVTIPEGQTVNDVQVFGQVTNNFFDTNANTYEITVYMNQIIDYQIHGRIDVYSLSDGSLVGSYPGSSALYFSHAEGYSTFQRYLIAEETEVDGTQCLNVSVYSPVSYSSPTPQCEHTFNIPYDNVMYSDGPYINYYYIDGQPYYVLSQYEKPYMDGYDETTWEPVVAEDNNYLITVYNGSFEQVANLTIPVEQQEGALYTFYTFGMFSYDDMTRGTFSGDDQLNFIVTRYDYLISSDSYSYDILVYNQDGQQINTIGEDLTTWQKLSDIDGQPMQYALIKTGGESESIDMVNIPSCETVTTFPGVLNGDLLSTNLDRYPKGDSYQYAIALGSGYEDEEGNTITKIGWYNTDLTLDHFVNINLGPNGIFAQHYFMPGSLNPYLFNTDDLHEYILIANIQDPVSSTTTSKLCIANDNGEIVREFEGDETKGAYNYGYLSGATGDRPRLVVGYLNDNREYTLDMYDLPFSKFAGGTGTHDDPYLIATPGDLNQVRNTPSASYALANDIDMSKYSGSFKPIDSFTGSLDGRGYSIDNLDIDASSMYAGVFSDITDGNTISNITFNEPYIDASSSCFYAGVLAGSFSGENATITNVHVNNAVITGDDSFTGAIGGIAGEMTYSSAISLSSVNNITVDAPQARNVGGIVGQTRTGATINASSANGSITAGDRIGGIVGNAGNDVTVADCHAGMTLTGNNSIGGIAGYSSRALIDRCYSTGTITANEADQWTGNFSAGGIVGDLSTDWSGSTSIVVSNSLAAISSINLPESAEAKAVHRIVGRSIADEEWMEGEEPRSEVGLANNHAVASMTVNGTTVTSTDATTVEGTDVTANALNDDFFTSTLGFVYGTTAQQPWKSTSSLPILYFESYATDLTLDKDEVELEVGQETTITATAANASGEDITFTSSDTNVIEIVSVETNGETATATIRSISTGQATITVSVGGFTATCLVTSITSGIDEVENGTKLEIYSDAQGIHAPSATMINVYSLSGTKVASEAGDLINTSSLPAGIYIVVATDGTGNRATAKVSLR